MNQDVHASGLEELMKFSDTDSVYMLNLLNYKDVVEETGKTGEQTYADYMKAAVPFFEKIQAELIFKGKPQSFIIGSSDDKLWDEILIVKYSNKYEFFKLMQFKEYPRGLRASALKDSKLIFCK